MMQETDAGDRVVLLVPLKFGVGRPYKADIGYFRLGLVSFGGRDRLRRQVDCRNIVRVTREQQLELSVTETDAQHAAELASPDCPPQTPHIAVQPKPPSRRVIRSFVEVCK